MSIEQIGIFISFLLVLVIIIVLLIGIKRAKDWKFNPSEYRFVPSKNENWNLNVMLQGMTDQGVLWIISVFYLFIIIMMEIVLIAVVPEHLKDTSFNGMLIGFLFFSIGVLIEIFLLIGRRRQNKDYVKILLQNSLPYANFEVSALESILENEIKDGLLIHTKRFNFTKNYIFISKSRMKFSPIAIALKSIVRISYVGHNRGGIFIVQAELKDGRKVEMVFNRLAAYKFIAMVNYYHISVKW